MHKTPASSAQKCSFTSCISFTSLSSYTFERLFFISIHLHLGKNTPQYKIDESLSIERLVFELVLLLHRKTQLKLIPLLLDHSSIRPSWQLHCRMSTTENISQSFLPLANFIKCRFSSPCVLRNSFSFYMPLMILE